MLLSTRVAAPCSFYSVSSRGSKRRIRLTQCLGARSPSVLTKSRHSRRSIVLKRRSRIAIVLKAPSNECEDVAAIFSRRGLCIFSFYCRAIVQSGKSIMRRLVSTAGAAIQGTRATRETAR